MSAAPPAPDDNPDRTESVDSVMFEFTDAEVDFTPRPVRDAVLRHLPRWMREAAEKRGLIPARPGNPIPLAECLLELARLLVQAKRYAEAAPRIAEAESIYQQAGNPAALADCYHVAAQVHQGLGELDKAIDYLRREADLRRGLAA